ncbi:MAG TPA: HAMP domain-containing sensor histidine kinase, partial [Myxococcota bacterium]
MSSRRPTRDSVTTSPATPGVASARARSGPTIAASAKTMLATASHEIRAPLHTILGMSELLTRTTLTPAQAQYLDALRRAATSLTSLLDSLIDSPRQRDDVVRHERVWLPDIVEAAVATVRDRAAVAGLDLVVDVDNAVPRRVVGDGVRLQQVLINLLVNAVKYGERGTVTLRVRRDAEPVGAGAGTASCVGGDDAVGIVFAIEDTGPGIPAAKLKEIFVSGARLERHANIEGSGLGLAITRRIVEDLGGRLEVESRHAADLAAERGGDQRSGTTFRVRLPLSRASSVETVDGT